MTKLSSDLLCSSLVKKIPKEEITELKKIHQKINNIEEKLTENLKKFIKLKKENRDYKDNFYKHCFNGENFYSPNSSDELEFTERSNLFRLKLNDISLTKDEKKLLKKLKHIKIQLKNLRITHHYTSMFTVEDTIEHSKQIEKILNDHRYYKPGDTIKINLPNNHQKEESNE